MDRHALEQLGHHVVSRRVALGYRNRTDLANSLAFTVRTLADIEHGVRKASPGTYAILENKMAWAPGSIDTILAGGEPTETVVKQRRTTHNPLAHTATEAPSRASTEELLLELRRRIIAPHNRRPESWDDRGPGPTRRLARTRASSQHLTDPLPDPDAVCHANAAVGNALTDRTRPLMPLNTLTPLNDGSIFAGFRIVSRLGSGGMGEVYLIQHPRLPRRNALKILSADLSADPEYRARFNREADLASTLYHPHIVGVHDRGEYNGQLWLSMDFVDGQDAARLLADRYPAGMPVDVVLSIITAVASALDYAHRQGLLHRDVKPANIMLTHVDDDADQRILLADFGIARSVDDISGLTSTNMSVGTVAYSAPEQLMGEEIDGRADQYALAATTYHLLTGLQLFPHTNPAVAISRPLNAAPPVLAGTRPELAALDPVLAAALAKNPDQRLASCSDFARAFADQVSPTSLAIPIAPTASAPLPLATTSSVDAVAEDSGAEKVSSHHAPEVANDPAADSASDAPTQQALVSAGKARLAESDEIEPSPTPRSPMRGGTSQAPQQSEPSPVSSTPAPIPVLAVPPKSRFPQLRLRLPGNLGTDDKIILALGIVLLVLLLTGVLS